MANDRGRNGFVDKVRANTRQYIEELMSDNARLRATSEKLGREQEELRRQVDEMRRNLQRTEDEQRRLLDLLGSAEAETRRFEDRFVDVELQNSNLAALYAASYQLHATLRRTEVLLAIQEIVVNLIGSEELAILGIDDYGRLAPLAAMGVEPEMLAELHPERGLLARAAAAGMPVLADVTDNGLTACVPLTIAGRTQGFITIFRLLPQKPRLEAFDLELLALLATHAATALYCSDLHERHGEAD